MPHLTTNCSIHARLGFSREGRDEGQIGDVKKVLVSMRTDETYRETKMRLIHKHYGIDLLESCINDESTSQRSRYKGYHVFKSRGDVIDRLQKGKPISCFRMTCSDADKVHVAFTEEEERNITVSYLTLTYDSSETTQDAGVHFCAFSGKLARAKGDPGEEGRAVSQS